jgi:hypothetical protein
LTNGESDEGGRDEFREFIPNRRRNSAVLCLQPLVVFPQLLVVSPQLRDLAPKLLDQPRLGDDQGGKLVIRQTPIPGLHTLITPRRRSNLITDLPVTTRVSGADRRVSGNIDAVTATDGRRSAVSRIAEAVGVGGEGEQQAHEVAGTAGRRAQQLGATTAAQEVKP